MSSFKKYFAGLSATTFLLALASFFGDIASEMLYPILPLFLTQTLGATPILVGVVEGIAEATQNIVQGFSGWLSDKLGRRKPIALFGYFAGAFAKPLIGLSTAWTGVLAFRSLDRLASGTRAAPRDALIAASADEANRGKAFGLEGLGDNFGACLGPLLALALLSWFALQTIFYIAIVPGLLAALMILFVRERPIVIASRTRLDLNLSRFSRRYWSYLLVTALFGIGNSSNAFLILRLLDLGVTRTTTILIYALFNLVAALASYPAGYLSDVFGRKGVLLLAYLLFLGVYAGFGLSSNIVLIGVLFVLFGIFQGVFRAVGKAMAADRVPPEFRASGIGWYTATVGVTGLVASIAGGQLWVRIEPPATFLFGAGSALVGSLGLVFFVHNES